MTKPRIFISKREKQGDSFRVRFSESAISSEQLWIDVSNLQMNLLIREGLLNQLALRKNPHILGYCRKLLASQEIEDWFSAQRVLVTLGTDEAAKCLMDACQSKDTVHTRILLKMAAQILGETNAQEFLILATCFMVPNLAIDVTGWTKTAVQALTQCAIIHGIELSGIEDQPPLLISQQKKAALHTTYSDDEESHISLIVD